MLFKKHISKNRVFRDPCWRPKYLNKKSRIPRKCWQKWADPDGLFLCPQIGPPYGELAENGPILAAQGPLPKVATFLSFPPRKTGDLGGFTV